MAGANPADVARISRHLNAFEVELVGKKAAERQRRLGADLRREAEEAVRQTPAKSGTLADQSMSGWHRKNAVKLKSRATVQDNGQRLLVTPDRTAGLWRVLEDGREAHEVGFRRERSRYVRKTGETRIYRSKASKRATGAMKGKGTWTTAQRKMATATRRFIPREMTEAFRRSFR